ncbi:MAG: hypothetical protein KKB31_07690 [Nanoarchaeota archaeon]|nr:hypothetical protein [Nanoarchaeota archaeon]
MNNKIYKCIYCGRNLGNKVPHRCKGTFRKRNLQFRNRLSGQIKPQVSDDFCVWEYDEDDDTYFTECDNGFAITNGSLEDNYFEFCVYCGKKIKLKLKLYGKLYRNID